MNKDFTHRRKVGFGFLQMSAIAALCAAGMMVFESSRPLPIFGNVSVLPITLLAAALGWPLLQKIYQRGIGPVKRARFTPRQVIWLVGGGAALALLPIAIAIDLTMPFPADINLPMPRAVLIYPAIALVAEVAFHLLPLALLVLVMPATLPTGYLLVPVVFVEPLFQLLFAEGSTLQSTMVFYNVGLVSATQLFLFHRYGFETMMGLRIAYYLFWHILWGTARLSILFQPTPPAAAL